MLTYTVIAMPFTLEVQKHACPNGFRHVGCMDVIFASKSKAAAYYNHWNPDMRKLNTFGDWRSDWDPHTELRYVVREILDEEQTVAPFRTSHLPSKRAIDNSKVHPTFQELVQG